MFRTSSICGLAMTLLILSGCGGTNRIWGGTESGTTSAPAIHEAPSAPIDTVTLSLVQKSGNTIAIELTNSDMQPIASVRAWISFPKDRVIIKNLHTNQSFSLYAPGESTVDSKNGIVKIGLTKDEPISDQKIEIATFEAQNIASGSSGIDFYDFPTHTQVIANWNGRLKDVLHKPETPGINIPSEQ